MDKSQKHTKKAFTFAELMISLIVIAVLGAILYPTIAQFTPNSNKPLFKSAYKTFSEVMTEIVNDTPDGELGSRDANGVFTPLTAAQLCERFCTKANTLAAVTARDGNGNPTAFTNSCATNCANHTEKAQNSITTTNGMRWLFEGYDTACAGCNSNGENCTANTCTNRNPDPRNGNAYNLFATPNFTQQTFRIIVDVNASNNRLSQRDMANRDIFVPDCDPSNAQNGRCGVFMYDYNTNANTGIFAIGGIPKDSTNKVESFNQKNLKNQDTFEIYVDRTGKIVAMSPAAWANLEDNAATEN